MKTLYLILFCFDLFLLSSWSSSSVQNQNFIDIHIGIIYCFIFEYVFEYFLKCLPSGVKEALCPNKINLLHNRKIEKLREQKKFTKFNEITCTHKPFSIFLTSGPYCYINYCPIVLSIT